MRRAIFGLGLGLVTASAVAQTGSSQSAQGDVAVTIYNNNLALVQDVRQVNLPSGRSRQEFPDVSAQIRPETVTLSGEGFGVIEPLNEMRICCWMA